MAAVMAAITPVLSLNAVTTSLLLDKNLGSCSDHPVPCLAVRICAYQQFWNLFEPPWRLSP